MAPPPAIQRGQPGVDVTLAPPQVAHGAAQVVIRANEQRKELLAYPSRRQKVLRRSAALTDSLEQAEALQPSLLQAWQRQRRLASQRRPVPFEQRAEQQHVAGYTKVPPAPPHLRQRGTIEHPVDDQHAGHAPQRPAQRGDLCRQLPGWLTPRRRGPVPGLRLQERSRVALDAAEELAIEIGK